MTVHRDYDTNIKYLEQKLAHQKDKQQRVILIDQLASHYAYTDVAKARALLSEQQQLLLNWNIPDLKLNFHLNTAIVENQLYNFFSSRNSLFAGD